MPFSSAILPTLSPNIPADFIPIATARYQTPNINAIMRAGTSLLTYDKPTGDMHNSPEIIKKYPTTKENKGIKHIGETPAQVSKEVELHGDKAAVLIIEVSKRITKNKEEFNRIANDMYCYKAMAHHFSNKVKVFDLMAGGNFRMFDMFTKWNIVR